MPIFRSNPYRMEKKRPKLFLRQISIWEKKVDGQCLVCGQDNEDLLFYCPVCGEYYCLDCVEKTIGGNICPQCRDLTFLQKVKVVS